MRPIETTFLKGTYYLHAFPLGCSSKAKEFSNENSFVLLTIYQSYSEIRVQEFTKASRSNLYLDRIRDCLILFLNTTRFYGREGKYISNFFILQETRLRICILDDGDSDNSNGGDERPNVDVALLTKTVWEDSTTPQLSI